MEKEKAVLTTAEACELLRISAPTLREWCHAEKHPPFVRVGRVYRFPRVELLAWFAAIATE